MKNGMGCCRFIIATSPIPSGKGMVAFRIIIATAFAALVAIFPFEVRKKGKTII
ncbi:MAG: hypothetical protein H7320_06065 [Ferruginibacter sp.]|nr:hypothetical protein [Ferruginibacter sp.]